MGFPLNAEMVPSSLDMMKASRARPHSVVHDEAGAAVTHHPGRCALTCRTRNRESRKGGGAVKGGRRRSDLVDTIERGLARSIVGDPPRRGGTGGEPPGVDQVGIDAFRRDRSVGYEIVLRVELGGSRGRNAENENDRERGDD